MALAEPRWYAGLASLKNELGLSDTTHDAKLKRYLARASAYVERVTDRVFYPTTATRRFDAPDKPRGALYLNDDLLSVTSISDDDGALAGTAYFLYPANRLPKQRVELLATEESWHWDDSRQQAIAIVGDWGYSADYEATGATLAAAITSTTATTCTVSDASLIEIGWWLLIDSERLAVTGLSGTTATIQRGVGGSTAATHANAASIYRYLPPADIAEATALLASVWYGWREAGGVVSEQIGDYAVRYAEGYPIPRTVDELLARYRRLAVGAR